MNRVSPKVLLLWLLVAGGCQTATRVSEQPIYGLMDPAMAAGYEGLTAQVDTTNGVDVQEAEYLVKIYFRCRYGGCGMPIPLPEEAENWKFQAAVGIAGSDRGIIRVAKANGRITCTDGPTVEDVHAWRNVDWNSGPRMKMK